MNKEKFQELLVSPEKIEEEDIVQLQQVVRDYPYFNNAHLLLLYRLHQLSSEKFNEQLKQSSLYLSNRFDLVNAIIQGWPSFSPKIKTKIDESREVILSPVIEELPKEIAENELEIETPIEENDESDVVLVNPVKDFSFEENFSFSLEEAKPIESLEKSDEEVSEKQELLSDLLEFDLSSPKLEEDKGEDLIDYFLKVNPRIVPKLDLEDKRGDISIPGLEENDEIVTETLADIYEQQGHYNKAKEAYQKLILKFPEKSTYFASRIQELEKRIK